MAMYHFSAKIIKRSAGRSATGAAAYRAGLQITDERTGEIHKYGNRKGVADHAILAPSRAPEWAKTSETLWNEVEKFEKRKDAQLSREFVVALPCELSLEQNKALLHGFIRDEFVRRGMAAQADIHTANEDGDPRNIHAHVMTTMRGITRNGFKEKKARNWNETKTLNEWRASWADHVNRALEKAGIDERVTEKSFKELGLDKVPTKHLGVHATALKRKGVNLKIEEENAAAAAFHKKKTEAIKAQQKAVDRAIATEAKRLAEEKIRQAETEREKREEAKRKARDRNLMAEAFIAENENRKAHEERELLRRGREYWVQVEKEYATEEADIIGYHNIRQQKEDLAEAKAQLAELDTVAARFDGSYDAALLEVEAMEKGLEDAQRRQDEALKTLHAEQEEMDRMREAYAARMTDKLNAQFEARQGGMETPDIEDGPEQEQSAQNTVEEFGKDHGQDRDMDDDLEISR